MRLIFAVVGTYSSAAQSLILIALLKFKVVRPISRFLFRGFSTAFIGVSALYFAAIDTWRGDWAFFRDRIQLHENIFLGCLYACLLLALGQWFYDRAGRKAQQNTEELLIGFVEMVAAIVGFKFSHYLHKAEHLTRKSFDALVAPGDQIRRIMDESSSFLRRIYELSENEIDITILESRTSAPDWRFFQSLRNWVHADPSAWVTAGSSAHQAISSGQHFLHPSKVKASERGNYKLSTRDKQWGDGSIFCHSLKIPCRGDEWQYIISIVTYGKRLCDWGDDENVKKTEALLREISRRLELELVLRTIKHS